MSTSLSLTLCDSISVTFDLLDLQCDQVVTCCSAAFTLSISCARTLLQAFRITDEALLGECASRGWTDGACAVRRLRGRREAYRYR